MLFWQLIVHVVVAVTRLLSRDGGMARDHGAPKAGQLPRPGLETCDLLNRMTQAQNKRILLKLLLLILKKYE